MVSRREALKALGGSILLGLSGCGSDNSVGVGVSPVKKGTDIYGFNFTEVFKDPRLYSERALMSARSFEDEYPDEWRKLIEGRDYHGMATVELVGVQAVSKRSRDQGVRVPITPNEAAIYYANDGGLSRGRFVGEFVEGRGSAVVLRWIDAPIDSETRSGKRVLNVRDLSTTVSVTDPNDPSRTLGVGYSKRIITVNRNPITLPSETPETRQETRMSLDITSYIERDNINVVGYFAADGNGFPATDLLLNELSITDYSKY